LVWKAWYAREVQRYAVDEWVHAGTSLRRAVERVRSVIGRQERWWMWHPWQKPQAGEEQQERCKLSQSTLQRWVARAGAKAQEHVDGQLAGVPCSGQMGADGLWARLRHDTQRVLLLMADSVTGVIWSVKTAVEEESRQGWEALVAHAERAGLVLAELSGLTSDGAQGLLSYLRQAMSWVHHQRCVWHIWRNLASDLAQAGAKAAAGLAEEAGRTMSKQVRKELTALLHAVLDAADHERAELALQQLRAHRWGKAIAKKVNEQFDRLLYHRLPSHRGLLRVGPEWLWRDFRLRLSHGRNHGSDQRLEQAGLLWLVYHNFTPAQRRIEKKRHYKHPGQSPLEVAGANPGHICYLDALEV